MTLPTLDSKLVFQTNEIPSITILSILTHFKVGYELLLKIGKPAIPP
jgi:hypothetical protein